MLGVNINSFAGKSLGKKKKELTNVVFSKKKGKKFWSDLYFQQRAYSNP